jgi:hypothetical protein
MRMTRRTFGRGSIAVGLVAVVPTCAAASPWTERLEKALNACVAQSPVRAAFSVTEVETVARPGEGPATLSAAVRLDWAPGTRLRLFRVSAATPEAAFADLGRAAADAFGRAIPGFAADCMA